MSSPGGRSESRSQLGNHRSTGLVSVLRTFSHCPLENMVNCRWQLLSAAGYQRWPLREMRPQHAGVDVWLSDHFVRYALVAWNAGLVGDAERLAFARLAFREIYGSLADTWDLCLAEQPAGEASLAGAIDRALLQALRDTVRGEGARLRSVSPSLSGRINRHRAALKGADFCLASVEPGRLTLAFHADVGWLSVRSRRLDSSAAEELPAMLKQEAAAGAVAEGGTLYLAGEDTTAIASLRVSGWRVARLAEDVVRPIAVAPLVSAGVAK